MKKIICLCFLFVAVLNSSLALELQGGVSFTVDSARNYLNEGQPADGSFTSKYYKFQAGNTEKVVYSYNNEGDVIGITVQYINEPTKAYIYNKNGKLIYIDKYDKPVSIYPHRGYRYDLAGNLILLSLTVSKDEMFRFDSGGRLIAHSVNNVIYDENGNIIGHGK